MKAFVTVTVAEHGHGSNGTWLLRTRRLLHVAATCLRSSSSVCSCQSNFEESLPWKACPESGWPGLARGRAGQAIIYYRFRAESAAIFFGIFPRPRRRRCQMRGSETGYFFLLGSWQEFCGPLLSCPFGSRRRSSHYAFKLNMQRDAARSRLVLMFSLEITRQTDMPKLPALVIQAVQVASNCDGVASQVFRYSNRFAIVRKGKVIKKTPVCHEPVQTI